jgi:hypothetical protein
LFFANECKVNPQFTYDNLALTQRYVKEFKFDSNDQELLEIAIKIIEGFLNEYGSEREFIDREGRIISREETELYFSEYIADLKLEDQLALNFTTNAVSSYPFEYSTDSTY